MTTLAARRPSLCLFCNFAALARPRTLLPIVQRANRSNHTSRRSGQNPAVNRFPVGKISHHPLGLNRIEKIDDSINNALKDLRALLSEPDFLDSLSLTADEFDNKWDTFINYVKVWTKRAAPEVQTILRDKRRGKAALDTRLRHLFFAHVFGGQFTKAELEHQKELANLCHPAEWFPYTRSLRREVHLHVGPTNSGKTYHALQRLEQAPRGVYLGPLRLLAHEVYTRLLAKGKLCALITGEEQRLPEGERPSMWSCTVEMAPIEFQLDVAVIDEIQMINHKERGWAWTQAFLGIQAQEVHLCGEARTVPLIRELCALVGDKLIVHEYNRLTPLKVQNRSLGGRLKGNLQKGDCIVSFSILGIHSLRRMIENNTGRKCAMVYGSLPPETRAQQARLFNDPDNDYDFLVASDAIGMGLNLSIKRVIFESTMKNDGTTFAPLAVSDVKQIAGRAGRYRTAQQAVNEDKQPNPTSEQAVAGPADSPPLGLDTTKPLAAVGSGIYRPSNVGLVTTLEAVDHPYLQQCMESEPAPIKTAGLFPPSLILERFANYFPPHTPFSYIMLRLHEISEVHPRFFLCGLKDQLAVADVIHPVKNLSIPERIQIVAAPTNMRDRHERELLREMAQSIADNKPASLLDLGIPLEYLDETPSAERHYLYQLEQLHKMLVLYLWLSFRFPHVFTTRGLANYAKKLVEDAIEKTLSEFSYTRDLENLKMRRYKAMKDLQKSEGGEKEEGDVAAEPLPERGGSIGKIDGVAVNPQVQEEFRDILSDKSSFSDEISTPDDENEYPSPELEIDKDKIEVEGERKHAVSQNSSSSNPANTSSRNIDLSSGQRSEESRARV